MANVSEIEHIEWDLPVSEMQKLSKEGGQEGWMDLSKLSLGTEMRNKMWEEEHKDVIGMHNKNHNFLQNDSPPFPEHPIMNGKVDETQRSKASFFNSSSVFDFSNRSNNIRNGFHIGNSLNPNSPSFSPSHQAQITSPTPEDAPQMGVNGRGEGRFGLSGSGNDLRVSILLFNTVFFIRKQFSHLGISCTVYLSTVLCISHILFTHTATSANSNTYGIQ